MTDIEAAPADRLTLLGKALSDPVRVRMIGLMARGRSCCALDRCCSSVTPADEATEGLCVCEFQGIFGLGQSRISYHLRILKESGLIHEEARGKWTFYSLDKKVARELVELVKRELKL
ncbi:MAG TPA: metalloregulator ArsR/SmtB family transcription factor [Bacillota bacterium]